MSSVIVVNFASVRVILVENKPLHILFFGIMHTHVKSIVGCTLLWIIYKISFFKIENIIIPYTKTY
jgi:hypothetical protein